MTAKHKEQGAALVAVMCIILLLSLLSITTVTVSKICSIRTAGGHINERSMLLAEGASNRIYWLLMDDRRKFRNRNLGEAGNETITEERLMADGVKHEFNYYGGKVEFYINDLYSGMQISGHRPGTELEKMINQSGMDEAEKDKLVNFKNLLMDYVDNDNLIRLNSMENTDYAESGMSPLPRNGNIQFREELLYLPGCKDFFNIDNIGRLSSVALIAPRGLRQIKIRKPSVFNATPTTIAATANLSAQESEYVVTALKNCQTTKTPLSELLDATLITKLKQKFSFSESGYYTIVIRASDNQQYYGSPLVISLQAGQSVPASGRSFYEWTLY